MGPQTRSFLVVSGNHAVPSSDFLFQEDYNCTNSKNQVTWLRMYLSMPVSFFPSVLESVGLLFMDGVLRQDLSEHWKHRDFYRPPTKKWIHSFIDLFILSSLQLVQSTSLFFFARAPMFPEKVLSSLRLSTVSPYTSLMARTRRAQERLWCW